MKAILLSAILVLLISFAPLAEAKNVFYPMLTSAKFQQLESARAPAAGKLLYYGGPVISHTNAIAVMWGTNVVADTKNGIGEFLAAAVKSDMMDWMDQYNTSGKSLDGRDGTNQRIGKGSFGGTFTINPAVTSGTIDDKDIQVEMQKQIDAGKLPKPSDDTLFMIYFPPGMKITIEGMGSCSEFCAYHGFKGTPTTDHFFYGVHPDLGGACSFGCGFGDHFGNVTAISAHEFCEAITDPYPTPGSTPAYPQAWNDNQGQEIGDLCAGSNNNLTTASGKTFKVQSEFDNSTGACSTRNWTSTP